MKYFLKRYIPVYRSDDRICLGFAYTDNYIEIEYSEFNYNKVQALITHGITDSDRKLSPYNQIPLHLLTDNNSETDRVKLFFDYLDVDFSDEIKDIEILIIGAGANGSQLSYMLAQVGFNNIHIVDFDVVESSDINRNMLFNASDLGNKKVHVITDMVRTNFQENRVKGYIGKIDSKEELEKYIKEFNPGLIVKASDPDLNFRVFLNELCFNHKIPYFDFSYSFQHIKIGPLYVPGITSCDKGLNELMMKHLGSHYDFSKSERLYKGHLYHPSISYVVNIATSLALKEILFFLTGKFEYCLTIGKMMSIDSITLNQNIYEISCKENCEICSELLRQNELL